MKLTIRSNYKSLNDSNELLLPDFVVITGENGSGKSQLLKSIKDGSLDYMHRQYDSLSEPSLLTDESCKQFESIELIETLMQIIQNDGIVSKQTVTSSWRSVYSLNGEAAEQKITNLNLNNLNYQQNQNDASTLEKVYALSGKEPKDISFDDIIKYSDKVPDGIFSTSLSFIFFHYYLKLRLLKGIPVDTKLAPWVIFNQILTEANFKYQVNYPDIEKDLESFKANLINVDTNKLVELEDLSSGERTIMSLFFVSYNSNTVKYYPDVLLLDEPDATLHPSLAKTFIDVVENVLVKKLNIKVILTTHSPSTVALSPPESIYLMNKNKGILEKVEKDVAIKSLTYGLNNLSISYEKKIQVFVESDFDSTFFNTLYNALSNRIMNKESSLFFISCGKKEGGCERVKDLTTLLYQNENYSVAGIIDFDGKNFETDRIKVLGLNNRYSIENYIYDPLILSVFFQIQECKIHYECKMEKHENFNDIGSFSEARFQAVVDSYINYIEERFKTGITSTDVKIQSKISLIQTLLASAPIKEFKVIELINNNKIKIPTWYLMLRGHDLEEILILIFPFLKGYMKDGIKETILKVVFKNLPTLLPFDLVDLLIKLMQVRTEK